MLLQPHSQGSSHLLEVVCAAGVKDGAALQKLQGLLDSALEAQDQCWQKMSDTKEDIWDK